MAPTTRAQIYEELKELRRQGGLAGVAAPRPSTEAVGTDLAEIARIAEMLEQGDAGAAIKAAGLDLSRFVRGLELHALAERVFGDEAKAKAWLDHPNKSMSGQRPIDLLQDELGAAVVRETLDQIDHGIFA